MSARSVTWCGSIAFNAGAPDSNRSLIVFSRADSVEASCEVLSSEFWICADRPLRVPINWSDCLTMSPNTMPLLPLPPEDFPSPFTTCVRLRMTPPLTSTAAEASTPSTVAAEEVLSRSSVPPSLRSWPLGVAGGVTATKTSPSGVAVRSCAVVPTGNRTPSRIRS
ncbi:Uncharacterised protein [Mycobacteroides abscessus subsp. abscessus]|nr:Uncharacterised protein [Mycobacteroides abscessus subsp. abscessus]SKV49299.1 Uncharacterised protein [Mycobacteroides abscessus subsp. abscessus]